MASSLRELRRARLGRAIDVLALELAIWFHDAVYRPGREDNEEASARLALRWSSALGLDPALGQRAADLILATRHDGPRAAARGRDPVEALLQDIDLAILGAGWAGYLRYERGIAREHAGLSGFREGRARLLRELLARPALYRTASFRRLEGRARRNLARSLARLEGLKPGEDPSAGRGARPDRR